MIKKKTKKKNYQGILIEYLNNLNNSNSKIEIVAKEIISAFFKSLNGLVLNKNDELKYLIVILEEKLRNYQKNKILTKWKIILKNNDFNNKKTKKKFEKNKNNKNDIKDNDEEEESIIIPSNDDIESLREKKIEKNNNANGKQSNFESINNDKEYFIIEENNNYLTSNNKKELTFSNNNEYKFINNKFPNNKNKNKENKIELKNNISKQNKNEKYNEKLEEDNGEELFIIDYDDETNSIPQNNKSDSSNKKNDFLIEDEKIKTNHKNKINNDKNNNNFIIEENIIKYRKNDCLLKDKNQNNDNIYESERLKEEEEKINNYTYNKIYNNINKSNNRRKKEKNYRNNYFINKSLKIEKKINIDFDTSDIIEKEGKTFSEIEEENRINYLFHSKNKINENEAKNLINLKKTINNAIKKAKNNIQKINNFEANLGKSYILNNNDNIISNSMNKEKENVNKNKELKIEQIEHISINNSNFCKNQKNNNNLYINKNISLFEKTKENYNSKLTIEKINIPSFYNNNIDSHIIKLNYSSNKKNTINSEKYNIIYNNEFSFAPETSSNKRVINKNLNQNFKSINNNTIENIDKVSEKNIKYLKNNLINKDFIEKNNNIKNEYNISNINKNKKEYQGRLINEEMIKNFLNNHKNERILKLYKNNINNDLNLNNNNERNSNNDYKNKYLGYTLEGIHRKKFIKNKTESNINKNIIYEDIKDKTIKSPNKEIENISGLDKICNMLDDLFYEINIKMSKNINSKKIEENKNIIDEYNNKNYYKPKISFNKIINTDKNKKQNFINLENNKSQINDKSRTNSILDYSNFIINDQIINNFGEISQNISDQSHLEKISNKNTINNMKINKKEKNILYAKERNDLLFQNKNKNFRSQSHSSGNRNIMNFPLANMNFNQRLQHYNNKKNLDIEKIKNDLIDIEEDIYTFYPKTNKNYITYENKSKSKSKQYNNYNDKRKMNYNRINQLYMDYKERKARIKQLAKENDLKDGISFSPHFCSNNKRYNKSKGKVKNK